MYTATCNRGRPGAGCVGRVMITCRQVDTTHAYSTSQSSNKKIIENANATENIQNVHIVIYILNHFCNNYLVKSQWYLAGLTLSHCELRHFLLNNHSFQGFWPLPWPVLSYSSVQFMLNSHAGRSYSAIQAHAQTLIMPNLKCPFTPPRSQERAVS